MKILIAAVLVILFNGCGDGKAYVTDNELRQKLFFQCLDKIPKGPERAKYNDWQEVISECSDCAYHMSIRYVRIDSITSYMIRR